MSLQWEPRHGATKNKRQAKVQLKALIYVSHAKGPPEKFSLFLQADNPKIHKRVGEYKSEDDAKKAAELIAK